MPIELIHYKKEFYPKFQASGNAARFCRAAALEVCIGEGFDIGFCKEDWKFPGAIGIDPAIDPTHHATNLPEIIVDYIHSSHCLEHCPRWDEALEHWTTRLKSGGVLFLYLPHFDQKYWRVGNNKKHVHNLDADQISEFLLSIGYGTVIKSKGADINCSFTIIAEKV